MELLFFILVTIAISIAGGLLYVIYIPVKLWLLNSGRINSDRSKLINKIYIGTLLVIIGVITYTGIFPDESFYEDEFKEVTFRDLPKSGEFVTKSASYPDFHGEYCSQSKIRLSKQDYSKLLWELHKDKRLTKATERMQIYDGTNTGKITYQFTRPVDDNNSKYLYIGFDNDSQTIYIDVCQN